MSKERAPWTPYGLEAIRQAHIKRRRILGMLAALLVLLLAFTVIDRTTSERLSLSANGDEITDGITIPEPEQEEKKDHVTVSLQPGRVSRVESGKESGGDQIEQSSAPQSVRAAPFPWKLWLVQAMPFLLAALVAYLLAKRRGKFDEINFGVYKGSMPLEMITAHHEAAVFTRKWARTSVFGKKRVDHLPIEVAEAGPEEG